MPEAALDDIDYWTGLAETPADDCIPHFYYKPVQNRAESDKAGRPKFDDVPYVEIIVPGDKHNVINRKVSPDDAKRWPQAWAAFLQGKQRAETGTPVEEWPYLTRARVAELKALRIDSVEAVAAVSDTNIHQLGPDGMDLRKRAQHYLAPDEDEKGEMRAEIKKAKNTISDLKNRVKVLEGENKLLREQLDDKAA